MGGSCSTHGLNDKYKKRSANLNIGEHLGAIGVDRG